MTDEQITSHLKETLHKITEILVKSLELFDKSDARYTDFVINVVVNVFYGTIISLEAASNQRTDFFYRLIDSKVVCMLTEHAFNKLSTKEQDTAKEIVRRLKESSGEQPKKH
jgi:hypothetical protein